MDEQQNSKRKDIIKNVAIIFLVLLLLLTLFSKTIYNKSLPEVAVQYPMYGTITSKIRLNGAVNANSTYGVTISDSRFVDSVNVRVGDRVEKGDLLFTLEEGESNELTEAKLELTRLENEYARKQLTLSVDLSSYEDRVTEAEKALSEAKAIADGLSENSDALAVLKKEITEQEKQIALLEEELRKIEAILSEKKPAEETESDPMPPVQSISSLKATLDMLKNQKEFLSSAVTSARSALTQARNNAEDTANQKARFEKLVGLLDSAASGKQSLERFLIDFDLSMKEKSPEIQSLYQTYLTAKENAKTNPTAYREAMLALIYADPTSKSAVESIKDSEKSIEDTENEYALTLSAYRLGNLSGDEVRNRLNAVTSLAITQNADVELRQSETTNLENRLEALESEISRVQSDYDAMKAADERVSDADAYQKALGQKETVTSALEAANEVLAEKNARKAKLESRIVDPESAEKDVKNAERELTQAQKELSNRKQSAYLDSKDNALEIERAKTAVENQKKEIARLEKIVIQKEVTSKVSGVISSIGITVGKEAAANTPLMNIDLDDMGYTLSCRVTAEQARQIRVGDVASLLYYYGDDKPTLRVLSVANDPNDAKSKNVTMEVTGASPGENLTFTLGENNRSYDAVLPNNAVREDSNGKFVYIVTSKNTPLGNRYTVKRVEVTVLASDEKQSAVSGINAYSDYVVTTVSGSGVITDGTQVRLAE